MGFRVWGVGFRVLRPTWPQQRACFPDVQEHGVSFLVLTLCPGSMIWDLHNGNTRTNNDNNINNYY